MFNYRLVSRKTHTPGHDHDRYVGTWAYIVDGLESMY